MFTCEFCGKELSNKQNLKIHQTKTKYCLEKQKLVDGRIVTIGNVCVYCGKNYHSNSRMLNHELTCPVKSIKENYNDKLKIQEETQKEIHNNELTSLKQQHLQEISILKDEITALKIEQTKSRTESEIYTSLFSKDQEFILEQSKRLIDKSTGGSVINNNIKGKYITMNALNLTQERIDSVKDTYTINHYDQGGIGQADWVVDNLLTDENGKIAYRCTDKNRKNFIYQDDKGNVITDIECKKLKEAIRPIMNIKLKEFKKIKYNELADVDDDDNMEMERVNDLYVENKELGIKFDKRLVEKTYV